MVLDHWSNDAMVSMDRCGLVQYNINTRWYNSFNLFHGLDSIQGRVYLSKMIWVINKHILLILCFVCCLKLRSNIYEDGGSWSSCRINLQSGRRGAKFDKGNFINADASEYRLIYHSPYYTCHKWRSQFQQRTVQLCGNFRERQDLWKHSNWMRGCELGEMSMSRRIDLVFPLCLAPWHNTQV